MSPAHLGFDEIDVATQNSRSHHYWFVDGETNTFSAPFRNVWPSELDLMARLAGMALQERWSDWNREPFTSNSRSHVSVWQKSGVGRGTQRHNCLVDDMWADFRARCRSP